MPAKEDLLSFQTLKGTTPAARRRFRASSRGLYALLILYIAISLGYYIAGMYAMTQEWFYPSHYAREPINVNEDTASVSRVESEAKRAGIEVG
ncbi:MAG: hypothetical protein ACRD4O_11395, partial [Bryobacteraceae bacterium]